MKESRYRVGGKGKTMLLSEALSKASQIYAKTGIFAAVEQVIRKGKRPI